MAQSYLSICTILSFGVILYTIYEKLLQGTGKTTLCTIAQIIRAVSNIILDPIFIFGYFGLPEMGIKGAAVTAYGVYYKIQQFMFFAAFGLNNAIIPIVSFNYGMRDKERVQEGIKYGVIYTLIIMAIGLVGLQLFANQLIGIFTLSKETHRLCILSIRIVTLGYLFAGANIAYQGIFQALDSGLTSLVVSLLRLIIIALPLAYIFTKLNNATTIIWTSFPIAEGVAMIIAIFIMKALKRDKVYNLLEK